MNVFHIGLGWFFLALILLNFFATIILKGTDRFLMSAIFLWVLLFFSFTIVKVFNNTKVEDQQEIFDRQTKTDLSKQPDNLVEFERVKKMSKDTDDLLINILGFQSAIAFIWQLVGVASSRQRYYISSAVIFFILTIIYLIIEFKDAF